MGLVFLNNGQYPQAAAAFKRVIKADPDSIEAHYGLGQAYLELGAFDDATTATEEVLKRNPSHQHARELLQIIKFAKNREKQRETRKKVLKYAAVFGVIAVYLLVAHQSNWFPFPDQMSSKLSLSISLEEPAPSRNGSLDAKEEVRLRIKISNTGGTARDIRLKFEPAFIEGVDYRHPDPISKLGKNRTKTIAVSLGVRSKVRSRTQAFKISVIGPDGALHASENFPLNIREARRR